MNNYDKKQNLQTVTYTISEIGFKYHTVKGKFLKGSTISKRIHPIEYVEQIKEKLLISNKLIDKGSYYELKDTVKIGALMSYNLHHGTLKKEFENPNNIVISSTSDQKLKEEFDIRNIHSTDEIFKKTFDSDSLKLEKIYKYKIRKEFLEGNNPNDFSETEQLVFDILKKENQITNARHGNASLNEADIVDETLGIQIEVVTAFKLGIKDRLRQKHDSFILAELIDTNLTKVSEALNKKFYKKTYTTNYKKELAIFSFGDTKSTKEFLKKLKEKLEQNPNIKNNFNKIHFIIYDFIREDICYVCKDILKHYNENELNLNFINKTEIDYESITDEEEYLFITKNIFKAEQGISIQKGKDFKKFAKNLRIII